MPMTSCIPSACAPPATGSQRVSGKLGAFIGVFLFPVLQTSLGLRGTLLLTAGVSVLGLALTFVLPEPAGRSLEEIAISAPAPGARPLLIAEQQSAP